MIMITMISCSVCGIMYISIKEALPSTIAGKHSGCYYISNAMLSGVMAVASSGESIEIWQAMSISVIGCLLYTFGSGLLQRLEIDDPTEAFLIYGVQSFWGVVAVGFFHGEKGFIETGKSS